MKKVLLTIAFVGSLALLFSSCQEEEITMNQGGQTEANPKRWD